MKRHAFFFIVITVTTAGCGTIFGGTRQDVAFHSYPPGAQVSVDNVALGQTPLSAKLERRRDHTVRIEQPGYLPFEVKVRRGVRGWIYPDILFPKVPIIPALVDLTTGGAYGLTPGSVTVRLYPAPGEPGS